ncbi:MAG: DUF4112 domain-containing protein [Planctomycetaceae bacterium]
MPEPASLTADQERRLRRIRLLARVMDEAFEIPGTNVKIGWDGIIGLIWGVGDVATAVVSGYLIYEAVQLGLPKRKISMMVGNVAIDLLAGSVPIIGDIFDFTWKADRRNAWIVQKHFGLEQES